MIMEILKSVGIAILIVGAVLLYFFFLRTTSHYLSKLPQEYVDAIMLTLITSAIATLVYVVRKNG